MSSQQSGMSLGNHAEISNLEETTNGKNSLTSILGKKPPD